MSELVIADLWLKIDGPVRALRVCPKSAVGVNGGPRVGLDDRIVDRARFRCPKFEKEGVTFVMWRARPSPAYAPDPIPAERVALPRNWGMSSRRTPRLISNNDKFLLTYNRVRATICDVLLAGRRGGGTAMVEPLPDRGDRVRQARLGGCRNTATTAVRRT
jgi:hypothetical protein